MRETDFRLEDVQCDVYTIGTAGWKLQLWHRPTGLQVVATSEQFGSPLRAKLAALELLKARVRERQGT